MQKEKVTNPNELPKDYWLFVDEYLPNYCGREDVRRSNVLTHYIVYGTADPSDLEWIPEDKSEASRMNDEIDLVLYNEAVDVYNEKMKSYHFRLHLLREEVLRQLNYVIGGQQIDVSSFDVSVSVIRDHYTGTLYTGKLTSLEYAECKLENVWYSIRYSQLDIADLCAILDNLTIGQWKHLVVKNNEK